MSSIFLDRGALQSLGIMQAMARFRGFEVYFFGAVGFRVYAYYGSRSRKTILVMILEVPIPEK